MDVPYHVMSSGPLFDLWVEHYDDLDDAARRRMPLKPIYFLAPTE